MCLCVGTLNLTEVVIAQLDVCLFFPPFPVGKMFLIDRVLTCRRN